MTKKFKFLTAIVAILLSSDLAFAQFSESTEITPTAPPKVKYLSTVFQIDPSQIEECLRESEMNAPERHGSKGYGGYLDIVYEQQGFECKIPHKMPLSAVKGFVAITNQAILEGLVLNIYEDYYDRSTIAQGKLNVGYSAEDVLARNGETYEALNSLYFSTYSNVADEGWPENSGQYPTALTASIEVTPDNLIIRGKSTLKKTGGTLFQNDFYFIRLIFQHLIKESDSKIVVEYTIEDK